MKKLTVLCVLLTLTGMLSVSGTLATSETQQSANPLAALFEKVEILLDKFGSDPSTGDALQIATHFLTRRADGSLASESESRLISLADASHLVRKPETVTYGSESFPLSLWPRTSGAADQFVVMENTASEAVYFRVAVAIRCPEDALWQRIHTNLNTEDYSWSGWETITIGNESYRMNVATYTDVLAAGTAAPPSLLQIAIDNDITDAQRNVLANFDVQTRTFAIEAAAFPKATFMDAEAALDAAIPLANIPCAFN